MAKDQYQTRVDEDITKEIESFKQERGIETDAEAVRRLVLSGLESEGEPTEADLATDGSGYQMIENMSGRIKELEEQQETRNRLVGNTNVLLALGVMYIALNFAGVLSGLASIVTGTALFVPLAFDSIRQLRRAGWFR
jgi:hypothetical protein